MTLHMGLETQSMSCVLSLVPSTNKAAKLRKKLINRKRFSIAPFEFCNLSDSLFQISNIKVFGVSYLAKFSILLLFPNLSLHKKPQIK